MSDTSHADLGGTLGHGRVTLESEGELWHAAWEPRVLALTLAMGATGAWNIDMSRRARETLPHYASTSYYAIWFEALRKLLIERRLLRRAELAEGATLDPPLPLARVLAAGEVDTIIARGAPTQRTALTSPQFEIGERVRTRARKVRHHTRLPAYVRGKVGVVERLHGAHVFADTNAHGLGEQPQWLYTVVFDSAELWPDVASAPHQVSVDAWEPYLQSIEGSA